MTSSDAEPVDHSADDGMQEVQAHELPAVVAQLATTGGWEAAAAVIEQHWDRLASTAPEHLLAAIRSLPGDAFVDRPTFLVAANYLQHVVIGGQPARFNNGGWLTAAKTGSKTALLDTLSLLTGKAAGARTEGRFTEAWQAAEAARAALEDAAELERSAIRLSLPHLRLQWGRTFELADAPGAQHEYEEAYELAAVSGQPAIARRAAAQRAWYAAERGRLSSAEIWLARALDKPAPNGRYDGVVYLTSAMLHLDRGNLAAANKEVARTVGLGEGEHWAAVLWLQSMIAHDLASATQVDAHLAQHLSRRPQRLSSGGANGRYIRAAQARVNAIRGRSTQNATADPATSPMDAIIAAAIAHGAGKHRIARDLTRLGGGPEAPRTHSAALLLAAAAELSLGDSKTAARSFVQAHALIEQERLYSTYECIPPRDLQALASLTGLPVPEVLSPFHSHRPLTSTLSRREHEVLLLLAQRKSIPEAANALFLSANTLKSTVSRLYRKLGADSRSAALAKAREAGMLRSGGPE